MTKAILTILLYIYQIQQTASNITVAGVGTSKFPPPSSSNYPFLPPSILLPLLLLLLLLLPTHLFSRSPAGGVSIDIDTGESGTVASWIHGLHI